MAKASTFSANAKKELCKKPPERRCCAVAEAYGVLLFSNSFSLTSIRVVTENTDFSERLPVLFEMAFGGAVRMEKNDSGVKNVFSITDRRSIETVFETVSAVPKMSVATHLNYAVLEEDHCRASFLRGAFLAGGYVANPESGYHMELVTTHYNVCREICTLMGEMDLEPKDTVRKSNYVIYFKNSGKIEDFLTLTGAPLSALEIMSAKVLKDVRNEMNRKVNCDLANTDKTVEAAQTQILAIRSIETRRGLDSLGPKLMQTAILRMENPEATLTELCGMFDPPLTKSCLNHRLRKIVELSGGN
ncbi:MAG: DNA-binding protein WhiA [Oscillospiraceae bacterium]|nr:DNA-binding protein WhiA [Oscillospiraceae bacterium]